LSFSDDLLILVPENLRRTDFMYGSHLRRAVCAFALLASSWTVSAQAEDSQLTPAQQAWQAANKAAKQGPADVTLGDEAVLHVPAEMAFIPKAEATVLMEAWGNSSNERFFGLVVPKSESQDWVISIDHTAEGYVKDDEAKDWDKDALLQSLKDGTEEQNKVRKEKGLPELEIAGWIEPPAYDVTAHRLVWSIKGVSRGATAGEPATVNYNTYALGRDGYFELNLLTSDATVANEKQYAKQVLAALDYKPGKRYEDFNASTDHIAEYGIAALIGGIAAKKLGLLALAGVFLAKFAKLILVGFAVAGGAVMKLFRRKNAQS
jgi:uncharacterized membrane-anchored protein